MVNCSKVQGRTSAAAVVIVAYVSVCMDTKSIVTHNDYTNLQVEYHELTGFWDVPVSFVSNIIWAARWCNGQGIGLVIERSRVRFSAGTTQPSIPQG